MLFAIIILSIVILSLIYSSKNKEDLKSNFKKLFFVVLGFISFFILIRFFHPIAALIVGIVISFIPALKFLLNFFSSLQRNRKSLKKNKKDLKQVNISIEEARDILGVTINSTKEEIKKAYKNKIKEHHPDKGGCKYFFEKITQARDKLLEE